MGNVASYCQQSLEIKSLTEPTDQDTEESKKFSELVKLLEGDGFRIVKEKGSIRYYGKT